MSTIFITPEHLGDGASEEQTLRLIEILAAEGWPVELGSGPMWEFSTHDERFDFEEDFEMARATVLTASGVVVSQVLEQDMDVDAWYLRAATPNKSEMVYFGPFDTAEDALNYTPDITPWPAADLTANTGFGWHNGLNPISSLDELGDWAHQASEM